jgi:glyoxylase-like metal-dependent hydrolase (beta-lactamase superfamily II)
MTPLALHAGNPGPMTGEGNWTWLIDGARPVLIDAGVGHPAHLDAVDAAARGRDVHLVVTHAHSDHIAGAPAIRERRPASALSKVPWPERDRDLPWTALADGALIVTGEGGLEVLHTPGHAPDHICLWHAPSRSLYVGDMLVLGSTVVIPGSHGGSLVDYLRSLARLLALGPVRAFPAHGPVIEDPQALIHHYLAHRARREGQVMAALETREATAAEITARIYPELAPALEPMARESVIAHLVKLESEGRVARAGRGWRRA